MDRLPRKNCIVTGGGAGIGRAIAEAFAREGANVLVADIEAGRAESVAEGLRAAGFKAVGVRHDAGDEHSWRELLDRVGGLDVLVNNAASGFAAFIDQTSVAEWSAIDRVTGRGLFIGTKLAVTRMRDEGSVVNIASIAAVGSISAAVYGAAKAGVIAFTKSAAVHLARQDRGIRVNAIAPGLIRTEGLQGVVDKATRGFTPLRPLVEWQMRRAVPLGFIGDPSDIANAALFLASDAARYITGQTLVVDGGMIPPATL